jgi:hypothetical protein
MQRSLLLAIGGLLAVACNDSAAPNRAASEGLGAGGLTVSGIVYGLTATPDSQRVALEGATVTLARIGDLPSPGPGQGPDTNLVNRQGGITMLLDSVIPPNQPPPPPPPACAEGTVAATVVTGADGSWSAAGLEEGLYRVLVAPPENSGWQGVEYCGLPVQGAVEPLSLYLYPVPAS